MNAPPPVVQTTGLEKRFAGNPAVTGVELSLGTRDCLALFGPNGAGKTTLLRLVAGLLRPTAGAVRVHGVDVRRDAGARKRVGLILHQSMLYPALTVIENVEFAARLYGVPDAAAAARRAVAAMQLEHRGASLVRTLSRGLQQRASIARAMVHDPDVVLLDEPYTGLDEVGAQALTALLRRLLDAGATLILVTHNVAEGLALASHAAVMTQGRMALLERRPGPGFDVPQFQDRYRRLVQHA